jgi:hypothetical protein
VYLETPPPPPQGICISRLHLKEKYGEKKTKRGKIYYNIKRKTEFRKWIVPVTDNMRVKQGQITT